MALLLGMIAATPVSAELLHVRAGETLVSIARDRLGYSSMWRDICDLNREVFRGNCNKPLEPGLFLYLPTVEVLGPEITRTPDPTRERASLPATEEEPLGPAPAGLGVQLPQIEPVVEADPAAATEAETATGDGGEDPATEGSSSPGADTADPGAESGEPGEGAGNASAAADAGSTGAPVAERPAPSGPIILPGPAPRSAQGEPGTAPEAPPGVSDGPPPGASAVPGAPVVADTAGVTPPAFVPNAATTTISDTPAANTGAVVADDAAGAGATSAAAVEGASPIRDAAADASAEAEPIYRLSLAETEEIPFTIPEGYAASLADDGSALFLFGYVPGAPSSGRPGVWTRLPDEVERAVSGKTIDVALTVIADMAGEFDVAYSTAEVGDSGWRRFEVERGQQTVSFRYDVPPMIDGAGDYIGILPDPLDAGQIIGIRDIEIRLVE